MQSIQTLDRGLDVLLEIASSPEPLGVNEVSRRLDVNKASVARFLATLARRRFVERDEQSGKYKVGPQSLTLVSRNTFQAELVSRAQRHMEELRDLTGETVGLYLREGLDRVCIHSVESNQELRRSLRVGDRKRLTLGSTGRVFLAFMPLDEARRLVDICGLTKLTPQTTVDEDKYFAELEEIRRRGAAMTVGQTIMRVSGLSVPVLDGNGTAVAVISVSGPSTRWTPAQMEAVLSRARGCGQAVARDLCYQAPRDAS